MADPYTPTSVEQITPAITLEWYFDHQIVLFRNTDVTRRGIDDGIAYFSRMVVAWPDEQPLLVIFDASFEGAAMTPYARERIGDLVELRPELPGRTAILIQRGPVGHVARLFTRFLRQKGRPRQIFLDLKSALKWLADALD